MIDNLNNIIFAFVAAGFLSYLIVRLVIMVANKYNILDYPQSGRKIHIAPVPLLGGLAIYFAWTIMILIFQISGQLLDSRMDWSMIVGFLVAGLILVVGGALDDKYALSAKISVWGPIIASIVVIGAGLRIAYVTNFDGSVLYLDNFLASLFGSGDWGIAGLSVLITFLWLMGITYTTKLLDGIDGLSSSIGLIASLVIFVVSLSWDVVGSTTSLLSISLAGAIFGFLIWNWHPAKIFLGEGGSTFIGFSLGVLAIISGSKIATALLVMGLPLLDIFWVIIKRIKKGQAIWHGDREHLHFRLLSAGLSQRQIVLFLSTISLTFGLVSIFFTTKAKVGALVILVAIMFLLSTWLSYRIKQTHD